MQTPIESSEYRQVAQTTRAPFDHFLHTPHVLTFEILDKRHLFCSTAMNRYGVATLFLCGEETFKIVSLFFESKPPDPKHRSCTVWQIIKNVFAHLYDTNNYFPT